MTRQRVWLLFLALLTIGSFAGIQGDQRPAAPQPEPPTQPGAQLRLTGEVVDILAPRVFTIREGTGGADREWLVLAPRALSPGFVGATVTVEGSPRRFTDAEAKRNPASRDLDERTRARLIGRTVLVAVSVLAIAKAEPAPVAEPTVAPPPQPPPRIEAPERPHVRVDDRPLTIRTGMLAANLDVFAGRPIRLLNGRVVGVLEPRAFLIEPATSYLKMMGTRDRLLVLLESSTLRVSPELIVSSIVTVTGVARTLVGIQVTREVPWPAWLDPNRVERLEVLAVVLATSVQTSDGVELTNAPAPPVAAHHPAVR